jgi:DNA polymerase III alpha subunit
MAFLTLDDPTGMAECTLFPAVFRHAARELAAGGPLRAEGRVTEQYGVPGLEVERLLVLDPVPIRGAPATGASPGRSAP